MPTVFTNGKFQLLHSGHFNLLMFCRKLAGPQGKVVVAIDSDERYVKEGDGTEPIFNLNTRINNLKVLRCESGPLIDEVHVFTSDEDLKLPIKISKVDIMVKGSDWRGKNIIGSELVPWPVVFYEWEQMPSGSKISSSEMIIRILEYHRK